MIYKKPLKYNKEIFLCLRKTRKIFDIFKKVNVQKKMLETKSLSLFFSTVESSNYTNILFLDCLK